MNDFLSVLKVQKTGTKNFLEGDHHEKLYVYQFDEVLNCIS